MAAHEYFIIIDSNFHIRLSVKNLFPIHSGVDFSGLHITAIKTLQWEFTEHICQQHTNLKRFLFTALQMYWLCRAKSGKLISSSKQTDRALNKHKAAGTSHYFKPEMH